MKPGLALIGALAALFLLVPAVAVMAQKEVPPPYAGLKNPFPWGDATAQAAGGKIYPQCAGCHGLVGGNIAAADFSAADFPQELETDADYYFWVLSEGRLDRGMPPYKSSLTDEQRWQVITYLHSLSKETAPLPPARPPGEEVDGSLTLAAPQQAQSGQPLTLTVAVRDVQDKPVSNAAVKLFIKADFFATGLVELDETLTDAEGVADFSYTPREEDDIQLVARYGTLEATATVSLVGTGAQFYHPEAGINLPAPGQEVFIGPESSRGLGEMGEAPTSALRLPGGVLSWLLLVAVTIMLVWFTYFRVIYQVFRIPVVNEYGDTNTRVVPLIGMAIVVTLGIILTLVVLTGPYSHWHLLH